MTIEPQQGGRRALDRVLAAEFAANLTDLSLDELRERRHVAEQEEVDLSYARRLLQGRVDLLRAEQQTRAADVEAPAEGERTDEELARDLAHALSEGPRSDHGLGRHLTTDPSRVGEHRRAAEQAVADLQASDPPSLDDDSIEHAITHLRELEESISDTRHLVQTVMDELSTEVARRYREGEARVEDVLAPE